LLVSTLKQKLNPFYLTGVTLKTIMKNKKAKCNKKLRVKILQTKIESILLNRNCTKNNIMKNETRQHVIKN